MVSIFSSSNRTNTLRKGIKKDLLSIIHESIESKEETEMYTIKCTVKSVKGECAAGYKVGDHFVIKDTAIVEAVEPKGICLHALTAMVPYLTAYCRKTSENDWINMIQELQCPDSINSVVFSLERSRDIETNSSET